MKLERSRSSGNHRLLAASICAIASAAAPSASHADMTPFTTVEVQAIVGGTGGNAQDLQNPTNVDAPSSASVSTNVAGSDGSNAGASASGFADFGTLGVGGSGSGLTPPGSTSASVSGSAQASASWDDFLTAMPNAGSLLDPGTPVSANLVLTLDFQNSTLSLDNANGFFAYELAAGIVVTDPVTGAQSSITALDDCFVFNDPDFNLCGRGSHRIDIPGNTGNQPLTVQFAPVTLPLAILQPFELGVGLSFFGECNVGPDFTAGSSCSFDADAMHTSKTTLDPLGDFTLVAASGHDYSAPVTTPPGTLPEPGSLALVVSSLLPAALSLRRRSNRRKP
ncbi:MAG TPA: hypothetical protein VJ891_16990 [Casimicrobiaceae bacterium]|nr:hypothetical protein [Casimicrobiaceae bacterium]